MAVRFDNNSDRLVDTTNVLDFNSAYTIMAWFRTNASTGQYQQILALNRNSNDSGSGAGGLDVLELATNALTVWGQTGYDGTHYGTGITGASISTGTWYHGAIQRVDGSTFKYFLDGSLIQTLTVDISARAAATREEIGAASSSGGKRFDGRVCAYKAFTAALTEAEILQERARIRPLRFENLWRWQPLLVHDDATTDYAGSGRAFSTGGTLTTEDNPPISW